MEYLQQSLLKFPFVQSGNHVACHLEEFFMAQSLSVITVCKPKVVVINMSLAMDLTVQKMIISSTLRASLTIQHF